MGHFACLVKDDGGGMLQGWAFMFNYPAAVGLLWCVAWHFLVASGCGDFDIIFGNFDIIFGPSDACLSALRHPPLAPVCYVLNWVSILIGWCLVIGAWNSML